MNHRIVLLAACLTAFAAQGAQAQDKSMTTQVGGWNRDGLVDRSDELAVNYPYALVDRGAQRGRPGSENFTMASPMRGLYQVWINYWGNFGGDGYHFDQNTRQRPVITSRITLVFHENTPRERREEFVVPLRSIGELTLVKTFRC